MRKERSCSHACVEHLYLMVKFVVEKQCIELATGHAN